MTPEQWLQTKTGYCAALEARQLPSQCAINKKTGKRACQECEGLDMSIRKDGTCKNCKRETGVAHSAKYDGDLCAACRAHFDRGGKGIPPRAALQIEANRQAAAALKERPDTPDPVQVKEIDVMKVPLSHYGLDAINQPHSTGLDRLIKPARRFISLSEDLINELRKCDVSDEDIEAFLRMGLSGQIVQVQP